MKLLLTLLLTTCSLTATASTPVEKEPEVIKIHSLNSAKAPLQDPLSYKNVRIVELEKTPFFLQINDIRKLEMNDGYLFIQSSDKLYTYTWNGELMAQIGRKGNREDEYNELSGFYIDNRRKQITIIDYTTNKLINYNFWGDYMFTDTVPDKSLEWCYQTLLTTDNKLLNYHGMNMNNTEPYSLLDLGKKEITGRYFSYQPITVDNYVYPFSWHPMTRAGKDIDIIMPLCDTVYTYLAESSSFLPKYIIESKQEIAPKNKIRKHTPSYSGDIGKLGQEGFFTGFNGIYETDAKVLLQYQWDGLTLGYFVCDKISKTGSYHLYSWSDGDKALPFLVTIHAYKNEFVSYAKGKDLRLLTKIKDKKMRKQIRSLKEDSYCLIFYELE